MPPIQLPEYPSYYYPPIYAWVFQAVSFPQVSPPKPCTPLLSRIRTTWPAHPILIDFITRKIIKVDINNIKVFIVAMEMQECVPFRTVVELQSYFVLLSII